MSGVFETLAELERLWERCWEHAPLIAYDPAFRGHSELGSLDDILEKLDAELPDVPLAKRGFGV